MLLTSLLLRSESPSSMCTKLHTVAASNNRDHPARSLYYCLFVPHICGVFLRAHSVHGEPCISAQHQQSGCNITQQIKNWCANQELVLRSEIPSGMCAKLRTVAASNNRDHAHNLSYYCLLTLHI